MILIYFMNTHTIISKCQISKSKNLKKIINLGFLPPVNQLINIKSKNQTQNFFDTELLYCPKSKLVQLNIEVKKEIVFPKNYPYTSGTTKILRENFKELYREIKEMLFLKKKNFIVDIGSNDGNLLSNFKKDFKILGITPENVGKIAIKKGIPTLLQYFEKKTVHKILKQHGKPNIVTATNVFAHINNPKELLKNIIKLMDKNGVFISESHYLMPLIQNVQYDTIYHEHLRYYSLQSLKYFFSLMGLKIFHAKKINTHGGSIRVYASKNSNYKVTKSVSQILREENKILNMKSFLKFKKKIIISKLKLNKILYNIKKRNKRICGISAPSRSSTLINYTKLDENIIDYILEIKGSKKIGKYMPGTKIPILNEEILYRDQPEYALIFSWHISKEIISNLKKRGYKGKFIIPLPNPKIIDN